MGALILDGKKTAAEMRGEMTAEVAQLKAVHHLVPGLSVVLVGDHPASVSYVTAKQKVADETGITPRSIGVPLISPRRIYLSWSTS